MSPAHLRMRFDGDALEFPREECIDNAKTVVGARLRSLVSQVQFGGIRNRDLFVTSDLFFQRTEISIEDANPDEIKNCCSTAILRDIVHFLHLPVAIDDHYTPSKVEVRWSKLGVPR